MTQIELILMGCIVLLAAGEILLCLRMRSFIKSMGLMAGKITAEPEPTTAPEKGEDEKTDEISLKNIDLTEDVSSIQESLIRLCEKYNLKSCTLTSQDGLVIASSHGNADTEAAKYSHLYFSNQTPKDESVRLLGLHYKGNQIAVIIRQRDAIPEKWYEKIPGDIGLILEYWI